MGTHKQDESSGQKPSADDLAGIPVCLEEVQTEASGQGVLGTRNGQAPHVVEGSPEDLVGIPITAEGDEDLTVRPRKPKA